MKLVVAFSHQVPCVLCRCVVGTYQSPSGNCNTCYGSGTTIGPNCNVTSTIACTSAQCFCAPAYSGR